MTDRFYPLGLPQEQDHWKTSYEVQNEMRAYDRSAYPPGTAVHLPGARDKFGYATPGPIASRLAKPELALTEDIGVENPRRHHAIPRVQAPDDREVFENLDVPCMTSTYQSPVAKMSLTSAGQLQKTGMPKTRSLPTLRSTTSTMRRLSPPHDAIEALEDSHFSYFVPKELQRSGKDRLYTTNLSKLQKTAKVTMPYAGDGTGFRTQNGASPWWPEGGYTRDQHTSYRSAYTRPPFYRMSPLAQ